MGETVSVLSIDDDPDVRQVIAQILGAAGMEVRAAERLADGIQQALARRPDVVLLDLHMPEGDGLEACRALRALPELDGVPILLITGVRDRTHIEQAKTLGVAGVLNKPFASELLLSAVRRLAGR